MSDVSGIPYMGPMGQGNFFAPTFSYNPQINPSAGYAGPAAYSQGYLNNLFATTQASLTANADRMMQWSLSPSAGYFGEGGGGNSMWSGGTGGTFDYSNAGTGLTRQQLQQPWLNSDGSANNVVGGGANNPFAGGSLPPSTSYTSTPTGGDFFPALQSPSYGGGGVGGDWSQFSRTFDMPSVNDFRTGGTAGGGFGGNPSLDWSHLFQGGGGKTTDPYPGMSMPGGLNAPMTVPQQSGGVTAPTTMPQQPSRLDAPMEGAPSSSLDWSTLFPSGDPAPGMAMPGGLGSPMTVPEAQGPAKGPEGAAAPAPDGTRTYDFAPMFEGGGGFGTGGADTSQLFGANAGSLGGNAFSYNPYTTSGSQDTSGSTADDLAAQARARLADIIGSPETEKAVAQANKTTGRTAESAREAGGPVTSDAATGDIPLPRERPAEGAYPQFLGRRLERPEANVPRPPADIPVFPDRRLAPNGQEPEAFIVHHTGGRGDPANVVADWKAHRPGVGSQYIMGRDGVIHDTLNEYGYGGTGHIHPSFSGDNSGIPGAGGLKNANVVGMEIVANNDRDMTPAQIASLKQFAERNYPDTPFYGHSEVSSNRDNEGIRGSQDILEARPPIFNFDWSNAPIPGPENGPPRPPADIPDPRVSGAGFNALDAAAKPPGPSGVEKAQTFLNRSLQSILTEHSPENLGKAGMFLDLKQSMRQALQGPLGGQIMSGLQPKVGSLGITREDLAKAIANPAARFAGGDELLNAAGATPAGTGATASSYWNIPKEGTPEWNAEVYEPALGGSVVMRRGDETTGGASHYDDFPRTGNIEDRRNEFLTTTERAALPPYGYYGGPPPEAAATPLSGALGLGDLPVPRGGATTAAARPQRAAGDDSTDNRFDEAFNAFQPSMQDFQSPANDYSMFQQPASRADLARVKMDFGGGFSSSPEPRQGGVGPQAELTPDFMDVIQEVESSGNPDKVKGSYKGLYQLDNAEFRKYGGTGSIFDPEQNTLAAGAKMVDENQRVQDILGRELSPVEQYMVHQQGVGGALAHLRNPDQPAWKSMLGTAEGRQKGEDWAKEAIWGNMTPEMKKQFGNVNNVTSRDFLSTWEDRYYGILNR